MAICGKKLDIFQQNSPRLTNTCKNYEGMKNILYTATDDTSKVLNNKVPFRAQRLFFLTAPKHKQDYKIGKGIPVRAQRAFTRFCFLFCNTVIWSSGCDMT